MEKKVLLESDEIRLYMDLLRESEIQRSKSNRYFISVNLTVILATVVFTVLVFVRGYITILFSLLGLVLTVYWMFEQRETHILHEVRFRTMLDLERKHIGGEGLLENEWEKLGEYPFRRSPVTYVRLSRALPLVFAMVYIVILMFTIGTNLLRKSTL